jgi:hypothetical protein
VADGQIPISAVLTSASVHDSKVAIPLGHFLPPLVRPQLSSLFLAALKVQS